MSNVTVFIGDSVTDCDRLIEPPYGDVNIPKGGYNLVIADLHAEKVVNIDDLYGEINSHLEELGPAWTSITYLK